MTIFLIKLQFSMLILESYKYGINFGGNFVKFKGSYDPLQFLAIFYIETLFNSKISRKPP